MVKRIELLNPLLRVVQACAPFVASAARHHVVAKLPSHSRTAVTIGTGEFFSKNI